MKSRNLNAAQFADAIGVQRSSVSHILTGRNNASLDFLLKVLQRYPEIDTDWLLIGKGVMMRKASVNAINIVETKKIESVVAPIDTLLKETTGDLFKQPIDIQEDKNTEVKKGDVIEPFIPKQNVFVTNEDEEQKKPGERVNKTDSARQVEKIVIFYSDRTFVDYKPGN
jgi:transcriptional regulator with XRE-family HTH domain